MRFTLVDETGSPHPSRPGRIARRPRRRTGPDAHTFLAAAKGMAQMSETFREKGGKIYLLST
jgi:hypothetical protein